MKISLVLIALFCAGCHNPAPPKDGWKANSWTYDGKNGKTCGVLQKPPTGPYFIVILNAEGKSVFSTAQAFDSDDEAKTVLAAMCDRRSKFN